MPGRLEVMVVADGSAGAVYLDLVVRGTNIRKQVDGMMSAMRDSIRKPLGNVEKSTQESMERVAARAAAGAKKAAESTGKAVENSLNGSFSRAVAMANIKVQELEREYSRINEAYKAAISRPDSDKGDKAAQALGAQRERMYDRLEAARDRLAVEVQTAAQKEADVEQAAANKAAAAAERAKAKEEAAAQRAAATAEREAARKEAAERRAAEKAAAAQEVAAQRAEEAHRKAAEATKQRWKKALGTLGKGLASPLAGIAGKIGGVFKRGFNSAEKHAGHFKSRLRRIVSGALIFNGISAGLRSLTQYFSAAIGQTSEMQSALANLKGAAATAAAPLIQVLTPALAALANVAARVFASIAQVISLLTGKSVASMASAAKGMQSAGNAAGGAAKQMEKARRTLAGFDEIETLEAPDTGAGSGGGGGAGGADVNYDAALDLDTSPINEKLAGIFDVFEAAWDSQGEKVIASMKSAFTSVKALAGSIGDSFYEVFTNGTGQQTLESILSIFGNIMGCVDKFAERLKAAWDDNGNGTAIIQAWWDGLNDILSMFDRMSGATVEWLGGLDLSPALRAFSNVSKSLEHLTDLISDGLLWAYENVLQPFGSWVIEDAGQLALETLSTIIDCLAAALERLNPLGEWFYDNLLQPIGEWAGDVFTSALSSINDLLEKLLKLISGDATLGDFLDDLSFGETLLTALGVALGVTAIAAGAWSAASAIATAATSAFGVAMSVLTSPITLVIAAIAAVVAIGITLYKNWDDICAWLRDLWEGIKETAGNVWGAITGFFSETWNKIKTGVTDAWNNVTGWLGDTWNSIKEKASTTFGKVKDNLSQTWSKVKENASSSWENIKSTTSTVWAKMKDGAGSAFTSLKDGVVSKWNETKNATTIIWNSIKGFVSNLWTGIKDTASNIWNGIKSTVLNVVNGIKTGVSTAFNAVKTAISNVMNSIKSKISAIWNGIVSTIKGAINGIIGGINGMIRGIANGINAVIRALNKLHFSIPDWVPGLGGKSFGFNIGEVSAPQIPLLAKGGVIKQPTLAMMGEYPGAGSNPEIAAPQSAITEAVAAANGDVVDAILQVAKEIIDAIQENGGVTIGDEMLGRAVDRYNRKRAVINGGFA